MSLNLLQKEQFKKEQKELMIWLRIKLLIKLQTLQKNSQQNNSDRVTNEDDKDIPNERYVSPEKRQEIIVDLRLT